MRNKTIHRNKKLLFVTVLFLLLTLCVIPYVKVELNTYLHKSELQDEFRQTHMIDEIEYMKVFDHNHNKAQVLYVVSGHEAAIMTYFSKCDSKWELDHWAVLWASTGSADKFFWPYYR